MLSKLSTEIKVAFFALYVLFDAHNRGRQAVSKRDLEEAIVSDYAYHCSQGPIGAVLNGALRKLVQRGLVRSRVGPQGGYMAALTQSDLTVYDVLGIEFPQDFPVNSRRAKIGRTEVALKRILNAPKKPPDRTSPCAVYFAHDQKCPVQDKCIVYPIWTETEALLRAFFRARAL